MKEVILTRGYIALVDVEDFDIVASYKWQVLISKKSKVLYAITSVYKDGKKYGLRMHRLILGLKKGQEADHKNGNGLDNRRCNLRICDRSDNNQNKPTYKNNLLGIKGVSYKKDKMKYCARIQYRGKSVFLGYHNTVQDATMAYNIAAKKYHGEFAKLNL